MAVYYNEWDKYAAAWLRELIAEGAIAPGDVDERDLRTIEAYEIREYTQHHFFAGIGAWSYALRLAGWPDDRPVLTGSPPCQPFSAAGKRLGAKDERHLAPVWLELVKALRPTVLFGEQVATAINTDYWLDDLLNELEIQGYSTGAAVLPACGVGAPHIRQRIWFVGRLADTRGNRESYREECARWFGIDINSTNGGLADANDSQCKGARLSSRVGSQNARSWDSGALGGLADSDSKRMSKPQCRGTFKEGSTNFTLGHGASDTTHEIDQQWQNIDWLLCRDGKWRPVVSGTHPLVDGASTGMVSDCDLSIPKTQEAWAVRTKGYGNAIVAQVAAEMIKTIMAEGND